MVVLNGRQNMFECSVLYIGSAHPSEDLSGTDALQEPLRQRYPGDLQDVEGIDSMLNVKADCLEMVQKASGNVVQFPLDRLKICAAVRSVTARDASTGDSVRQFVPLNTLQPDTTQPAIFAAIIRRDEGRDECHVFVCSSPREALHLVNTTAAANLNLKALTGQRASESVKYQNGVPVIHDVRNDFRTDVRNGHSMTNGEDVQYVVGGSNDEQYSGDDNTIYIKSSIVHEHQDSSSEPVRHYESNNYDFSERRQEIASPKQNTIYIRLDKSNLVPTDNNTLEMKPTTARYSAPQQRAIVMQAPPPRFMQAPPPPPQAPVMYRRPIPMRPVMVRPPPPQPVVMMRPPIQQAPQRMYTRRVMSPPPRMVAAPPVYYRSRARSTSPDFTQSEMRTRVIRQSTNQPKWRSHSSDIVEYRQNRPVAPPTRTVHPAPTMFMNERAFSRRVNTDQRFAGYPAAGYNYPPGYGNSNIMMYDRPVSKSNPRYSSSSSEDGDDLRFSRRKR